MKHFSFLCFFFLLCFNIAEAQTYANIPGPENVLVVYDSLNQVSIDIKDYYQNARNIPASNIVGLTDLVNADIFDSVSNTTHRIEITQDGEIISDSTILSYGPINRHSWLYFIERIAAPIAYHLRTTLVNGEPLKNTIRFIVLCKGVPFRILTTPDHSGSCNQNVPVDALLCFLGEDINNPYHLMSFLNLETPSPIPPHPCRGIYSIENPYFNADPNFSMDHNFQPNFYSKYNYHFNRDVTLSYLVTHLDAMSFNDVKNMIDSSIAAINSNDYDWFIDADPTPCKGGAQILRQSATESVFDDLGVTNHFFKTDENVYTSHNKPVMSYMSNGTHTSFNGGNCNLFFNPDYIQTQLSFTYIAGSVFNTAESFNVNTLGTNPPVRRGGEMGQIPEFFLQGGTVGVGQVNHGTNGGIVIQNDIMLPSYLLGYTFIEAAYLGMNDLTDNRIVVGDPLTTIAWGKQTLQDSIVFEDVNLITGELDIAGNAAFITNGTTLRFKHNGFITGEGYLIELGRDYVIETINWNKSVFKSKYNNHPMLIWAPYPGEEYVDEYKIYRKWESAGFELIGSASNEEFVFVDNELEIIKPDGEFPKNAQYYVVAYFDRSDSGPSNQIEYYVDKAGKIAAAPEKVFSYNLMQNYPNPFNPITTIKYSIAKPELVTLKVYDILGSEIATLINQIKTAGNYEVSFNASNLASGMYLYKLTAGNYTKVQKMILMK